MQPSKKMSWRCSALGIFLIYLALIAVAAYFPPSPDTILGQLIQGFQGNLLAGFIANLAFIVIAAKLDSMTEEKIDRIEQLAIASEAVLRRREEEFKREQTIAHFEQFMKVENWHDVRFPSIQTREHELGFEYTIRPVRDSENGPRAKISEMNSYWLIQILHPANKSVLSDAALSDYYNSPIKVGEYYYCAFRNDSWHMSHDGICEWHEFHLSSKLGPVEYGISANSFLGENADPQNMTLVGQQFPLVHFDGRELNGGTHGCDMYKIFREASGSLYLKINDSPLKNIYMRNPPNTVGDVDYYLEIENLYGHGTQEKVSNIKHAVQRRLEEARVEISKVPWHRFPD